MHQDGTAGTTRDAVTVDGATDLWAGHRHRTRRAIVDSFVTMLGEENPSTISMPAVASRAGVSVRTLYRYFADKDALMGAASSWFDDDARAAAAPDGIVIGVLPRYLEALWRSLADNVAAVRAQHTGPVGRDLRRRRLDRARRSIRSQLPADIPTDRVDEVVDTIVAITSSSMFLELVDRMGHDPARSASIAGHLVELIVADATTGVPATREPTDVSEEDTP